MKVALITLVGLSSALTYVGAAGAGLAGTGPAPAAPTPLTAEEAQAFAMKTAEPFLNLPGLRLQADADDGIAKAEALLAEHLNTPDGGVDEGGDEAAEDDGGPGKKTGFSAEDAKQFRAAAASAAANQVPLLTLKDGIECSDLCIANQGELPDAEPETDADDTETEINQAGAAEPKVGDADDTEEEDDIEDGTDEGDDKAGVEEDGLISRLRKRIVSPPAEAPAASTETDSDVSDNADTTPANAAAPTAPAAPTMDEKANMSEEELLSKVESCVQSCMLNRAREVTPEDLDDRRAKIESILQKQEL